MAINPNLPTSWSDAEFKNVKIGTNRISLKYEKNQGFETFKISQSEEWTITFEIEGNKKLFINGEPVVNTTENPNWSVDLSGLDHEIRIQVD